MGLDLGVCRVTFLNNKIQIAEYLEDFDFPTSKINRAFAVNCKGAKLNRTDQSPELDTYRPGNIDDAIGWVEKNIHPGTAENVYSSFLSVLKQMKNEPDLYFYEI